MAYSVNYANMPPYLLRARGPSGLDCKATHHMLSAFAFSNILRVAACYTARPSRCFRRSQQYINSSVFLCVWDSHGKAVMTF